MVNFKIGTRIPVSAFFTRNGRPALAPTGTGAFSFSGVGVRISQQDDNNAELHAEAAGSGVLSYARGGLNTTVPVEVTIDDVRLTRRAFLLDAAHPDHASVVAMLSAFPNYKLTAAKRPGEFVAQLDMTDDQRALFAKIGSSGVLDEFNYSLSRYRVDITKRSHTNKWGDTYNLWGPFLKEPRPITTEYEDRRLAAALGLSDEKVAYFDQVAKGRADGSGPLHAIARKDISAGDPKTAKINPLQFDILVICNRQSRFVNEGSQLGAVDGSSFAAKPFAVIMSHPVFRAQFMQGGKTGSGTWGEGVWMPLRGTTFVIENRTGGGGGHPFGGVHFVFCDRNGPLEHVTKVKSIEEVETTELSYYVEWIDNLLTRVYCNIGGIDPKDCTYWGGINFGGISCAPRNPGIHYFGIDFYQSGWGFSATGSNHHLINCYFGYAEGNAMVPWCIPPNEANGFLQDTKSCDDVFHHACVMEYFSAAYYGGGGASEVSPTNWLVHDFIIRHIGEENVAGINTARPGDSHCVAMFGGMKKWRFDNGAFDYIAPETWNPYIDTANINPPSPELNATPGYTIAWPQRKRFLQTSGEEKYTAPCQLHGSYLRFTNPILTPAYDRTDGRAIAANGDADIYGYDDQFEWIVEDSVIEGAWSKGFSNKFRLDLKSGTDVNKVRCSRVLMRGVQVGVIMNYGNAEDQYGGRVEASGVVEDCDIQSTLYHVQNINTQFEHRHRIYRRNKYRGPAKFDMGAGEIVDFATYQKMVRGIDVYDLDSVLVP
jgi:hypothetical protein